MVVGLSENSGVKCSYVLAGRTKLATLLISEDARAANLLNLALESADVITLTIDGWTSAGNQSVYGAGVGCDGPEGRREAFYDAQDCSEDRHTGEFVSGKLFSARCSGFPAIALAVLMV